MMPKNKLRVLLAKLGSELCERSEAINKKAVRYEVDSFYFPLVYLNIKKSKNLTLEKNTNNVQNPDNVPSKQQTKDSC